MRYDALEGPLFGRRRSAQVGGKARRINQVKGVNGRQRGRPGLARSRIRDLESKKFWESAPALNKLNLTHCEPRYPWSPPDADNSLTTDWWQQDPLATRLP